MAFSNRKLLYHSVVPLEIDSNQPSPPLCIPPCRPPLCIPGNIPPPSPPDHDHHQHHPHRKLFLVCMLVLVVLSTLLLMFNVVYAHILRSRRRRNTMRPILNPHQGPVLAHDRNDGDHDHWDLLLDEQQRAMVVDHHVWYINTVGLPPSVIESIALCKYKRGDGLIDGTDCAVCLSEFEEGENLRVLPKCNHAFHVPCIDTWLRSHTNCPMCRAPVMSSTPCNPNLRLPQPPLSGLNSSEHSHDHGEDNRSSGRDLRRDIEEGRDGLVDTKALRRAFSMDSALSSSLVCSPCHIESVEISRVADSMIGHGGEEGSCSSSSSSLLQRGLGSMKRSLSCTGTLLSSRYA